METLEQPVGDRGVPAPFNEQMMQSALGELSDGARLAVQTCLDLWRDQKFGTSEFISFIKCYSFQSRTIAAVFSSIGDNVEFSDSLSCKSTEPPASCAHTVAETRDKDTQSSHGSLDSSPPHANFDDERGGLCHDKGYLASASEMASHSNSSRGDSSHGNGSSNGSGSDSAGKDNSPNDANDANDYMATNQRGPCGRGKRMAASRSAAEAEASNPDADPALAAAGSRKRRISSAPFPAPPDSPACTKPAKPAAGGRAHAVAGQAGSPLGGAAHRRQPAEQATPSRAAAAANAAAAAVGQDKRWAAGMYMDGDGVPRIDPLAARARDPHAAEALRHGRWADALATCPLAEVLTARANAVAMAGSGYEVAVRVVADVVQAVPAQDGEWGARMQRGAGGGGGQMRCKAVLAFQRAEGADALILGLYVHEYGAGASPVYAGRIMLECIDSPPVWPAPPGVSAPNERQGIVSAIVHGYMEAAAKRGFKSVHMHVPPPQERSKFVFVPRTLGVRLRVTMHLAGWVSRLLNEAVGLGLVSSWQCSTRHHHDPAAADALGPPPLNILTDGVGSNTWQSRHGIFNERFFMGLLRAKGPLLPDDSPPLPSKIAGRRTDLSRWLQAAGVRFATLPHAQYAAMALAAALAAEQRAAGIPPPPPPAVRRALPSPDRAALVAEAGAHVWGGGDVGDAYGDVLGWPDGGDADPARFYDHGSDGAHDGGRHRHACGGGLGYADQSIYPVARPPYAPLHPPAGRRAGGGGPRRMAGGGWADGLHALDGGALWPPETPPAHLAFPERAAGPHAMAARAAHRGPGPHYHVPAAPAYGLPLEAAHASRHRHGRAGRAGRGEVGDGGMGALVLGPEDGCGDGDEDGGGGVYGRWSPVPPLWN